MFNIWERPKNVESFFQVKLSKQNQVKALSDFTAQQIWILGFRLPTHYGSSERQ